MTLAERLESKSIPVPECGCTIWLGSLVGEYGRVFHDGKLKLAHRAAWECVNGPIPKDAMVLHSCDTPSCINPSHLFLGNQNANMADMVSKNRSANQRGANNGNAKLTAEQVGKIRSSTEPRAALAQRYGVKPITIWEIRTGRAWRET